jgi:hypothetical protein
MANTFIMRWPTLGKQVRYDKIDHNQQIFDWFEDQLPLRAVHGHTMVSGWRLYAVAIPVKTPMTWDLGTEVYEDMTKEAVGNMGMSIPAGLVIESSTKYGEVTEYMGTISFARARQEDLPILQEVGAVVWKAVIHTKEVIVVEYVKADGAEQAPN